MDPQPDPTRFRPAFGPVCPFQVDVIPVPVRNGWASTNFRQRALDTAIVEITKKTDLNVAIESLERSKHRRVTSVTFAIKEQAVPKIN